MNSLRKQRKKTRFCVWERESHSPSCSGMGGKRESGPLKARMALEPLTQARVQPWGDGGARKNPAEIIVPLVGGSGGHQSKLESSRISNLQFCSKPLLFFKRPQQSYEVTWRRGTLDLDSK